VFAAVHLAFSYRRPLKDGDVRGDNKQEVGIDPYDALGVQLLRTVEGKCLESAMSRDCLNEVGGVRLKLTTEHHRSASLFGELQSSRIF
jgi:hypothetical protein